MWSASYFFHVDPGRQNCYDAFDMKEEGITFYNRYTGQAEQEKIMGERALRWVYGSNLGKLSLHLLIKRAFFSRIMGRMKDSRRSARDLQQFVDRYGMDSSEFARPIEEYTSFNDFFTRTLKPGSRPICQGNTIALPADGRHSGWQDLADMSGVFIKGQSFDLPALLGDAELAEKYAHGSAVLSRLCPTDYHRFHFVTDGTPGAPVRIPGPLASVSPLCLRHRLAWLWTNKRELTIMQTPHIGDVLILAVGATGVGAIEQTYTPGKSICKGDEQGYFAFGGSTIITFYEPGRIQLAEDILRNTQNCIETYARQGDILGSICS